MKTLTKFVYTMMTVGAISGSAFATGINSTNGNGSNSVSMVQNAPVSGIVKDSNGDPITGATVMVKGSNVGVTTDIDGHFSINAKIGSTLEIRFVGCKPQDVKVRNDKPLSITLEENSELLDEVVVTAMGISREAKSLSYARQSIDPESFTETRGTNLTDMLSGKSAGMQVVSGGGPTASTRIVLRGVNSITGNNQPLFVVDGVPIVNNMGEDGDLDFGNPANAISPDEIENIEVLKGANASALYGSDAANGVILITTKKGKESKGIGVDYGFNMMFGHLYNYPTYQNIYGAGQGTLFDRTGQWNRYGASGNGLTYNPDLPYGAWYPNMAGQNHRSWGMPMLGFTIIGRNDEPKVYEPHPETTKSMYQTSTMITNSVSINRKFDKGSFVFSYTGLISDDILKYTNKMNRHTFNARTVANLTKWLDLDVSTRYVYEKVDKRAYRNASNRNPVYMFAQLPRDASLNELIPWKHEDGTPFNFKEFTNPFWSLNETDNGDNKNWWMGNVTLTIKPFKFLRVRLRAATDLQNSEGWGFTNLYTPYDNDGEYNRWKRSWRNTNFDALVTFNKNFKNNLFSVNASVGASSQDIHGTRLYSKADQLLFSDFKSLSNAASSVSTVEDWESKKKQAVYGSASLGYDGWAYLDLTARNEWSSTLPKDNNSYFYWSAGSGIILSKLFKLDPHIFPLVKIRGSYAQVGNDTGFDRLVSGYYKDGTYYTFMGIPYFIGDTTLKNLGLKPEQTRSWELGAEVRLFDDRFSVDFTYYDKATRDQIVEADAPVASGYYKQMINAGKMTNKGVELSLKVNPIRTRDWDWTVQFNWSKNKNMVVELAPGIDRFELASGNEIKSYAQVGKPFGVFYGNDYKRDENGNICVQMDGRANYLPDQYLGSIQPDWLGGASTTLRWKDFVFSGSIDFQKGGKLWSYTAREGATNGNTVQTLQGRYEFEVSKLIYGENDNERKGMLEPSHTNMPNANYAANHVLYGDIDRVKGVIVPGTVYDSNVDYWAGQPCMAWVTPEVHWCHNGASSAARYIYDASYVKLRELSIGYVVPRRYLMRTFLTAVKVSAVGRNVAILYQNTPKGMDPQATSTTGNAQGFERGFTLPQATWGFDIKVSF